MISSLNAAKGDRSIDLGCFDLGLAAQQSAWLRTQGATIAAAHWHFSMPDVARQPRLLTYVVRPFLRDYFPDYDIYLWIDADVWLQDGTAIERYVSGALAKGPAIAHENERAYRFQGWPFAWTCKHFLLGYGPIRDVWLLIRPHLNAGILAIAADAPHWGRWRDCYQRVIDKTGLITPHDQFSLNHAIYSHGLPTEFLPATCNWICDRGPPMLDEDSGKFCVPYPHYQPISIIHLAGPAKQRFYKVKTRATTEIERTFRYQSTTLLV